MREHEAFQAMLHECCVMALSDDQKRMMVLLRPAMVKAVSSLTGYHPAKIDQMLEEGYSVDHVVYALHEAMEMNCDPSDVLRRQAKQEWA